MSGDEAGRSCTKEQLSVAERRKQLFTFLATLGRHTCDWASKGALAKFCFQRFDDVQQAPGKARHWVGTAASGFDAIDNAQQDGCGVFVVVQAGAPDQNGYPAPVRNKSAIETIRAVYAEFDDGQRSPELPLPPTVVGDSRNGSHFYWVLARDPGDFPIPDLLPHECINTILRAIAAKLGSDPNVATKERVMRLPGTFNFKDPASPYVVTLRDPDDKPKDRPYYTWQEIFEAFELNPHEIAGASRPRPPRPPPESLPDADTRAKRVRALLEKVYPVCQDSGTLFKAATAVGDIEPDEYRGLSLFSEWAARVGPTHSDGRPQTDVEIRQTLENAYKYRGSAAGSMPDRPRPPQTIELEDGSSFVFVPTPAGDLPEDLFDEVEVEGSPAVDQLDPVTDTRPCIPDTADIFQVTDAALAELAKLPDLYLRGRMLVERVGRESREIVPGRLADLLTSSVRFQRYDEKLREWFDVKPASSTIAAILGRPLEGSLRSLDLITDVPVVFPDGTLSTPGYDRGVLHLEGGPEVTLPEHPTQEDAAAAVAVIDDVVSEFPFASPAYKAAFFAALLTPLARRAFDGPSPIFPFDANIRGCGKGRLIEVISTIVTGGPPANMAYPKSDEEIEKRITAELLAAPPLCVIDDVSRPFGGSSLNTLATATVWKGRQLGHSRNLSLPANTVWFTSGNNLKYEGDMVRRVCPVRLESPDEDPEERSGFRYPDLIGHVRRNRGALLSAALTILKASLLTEHRPELRPWGSFEAWSSVVRAAIVHAGLQDPMEVKRALKDSDETLVEIRTLQHLILQVQGVEGVTAVEIEEKTVADSNLKINLKPFCPRGRVDARGIGYALRKHKGRVVDGRKLIGRPKGRNKTAAWLVVNEDGTDVAIDPLAFGANVVPLQRQTDAQDDVDVDDLLSDLE